MGFECSCERFYGVRVYSEFLNFVEWFCPRSCPKTLAETFSIFGFCDLRLKKNDPCWLQPARVAKRALTVASSCSLVVPIGGSHVSFSQAVFQEVPEAVVR